MKTTAFVVSTPILTRGYEPSHFFTARRQDFVTILTLAEKNVKPSMSVFDHLEFSHTGEPAIVSMNGTWLPFAGDRKLIRQPRTRIEAANRAWWNVAPVEAEATEIVGTALSPAKDVGM